MPRQVRPGYRRFEMALPIDHPVWSAPPRERAARARELIDLGLVIEKRLAGIDEKLDAILAVLTKGTGDRSGVAPKKAPETHKKLEGKSGAGVEFKGKTKEIQSSYLDDFLKAFGE